MRGAWALRLAAPVVALALALVAGGAAGGSTGDRSQAPTLRVGLFGTLDEGKIGDQLAFDTLRRKTGITAQYSTFVSPQAVVVAVTRGDVDIGISGLHSTVQAIAQGAPLRALAVVKQTNEWVFVSNTPTVAELRGKKVGYQTPGTETHAFAKVLLARVGVRDAELIAVPGSPNRAAALVGGVLDAAWLNYVDFIRVVREKPALRALASARSLVPFSALQVIVVSESYLESHRALLTKVLPKLLLGYELLYEPAGRVRWLARARATVFTATPADATRVYENYRRIHLWPRVKSPVTRAQWESRVLFWLAGGIVESVPSFERVWDLSFWRAAARASR
ncbi:MAG: ABC transporter substrate-binding protein [Actinobacteria bacterium]|nr:ABC transporter substrate-binding protein [Actinomycetota bacterium]